MPDLKWKDGSIATALDSGLDSLANGSRAISAVIDNDAGLDLYADFELVVRYTTTAPAAGVITAELFLLPTVDGTNYPEGSSSLDPQQMLKVGIFESRNGTTSATERLVLTGIPLPPRDFKVLLKNTSGFSYYSTANTLKIRPYKLQSA